MAPWVWWLGKGVAAAWPHEGLDRLVDHPFSRYVHRCLLVLAVAGLWPLTRALGCASWESVGWSRVAGGARRVGWGFAIGLWGMVILVALEGWMGEREWRRGLNGDAVTMGVFRAALSGSVVAMIEETLFRGVLFSGLRPAVGVVGAVVLPSLLYSAVHFLRRPEVPDAMTWFSGFETLLGMLRGLGAWDRLVPAFGTLFLLGVLFGLSRSREGSLYFSLGLHAALVFSGKMRGILTQAGDGAQQGGDLNSGWLAFAMTVTGVVIYSVVGRCRSGDRMGQNRPFREVDP